VIDLRQLRQFIAVAEELHFHRAAARLNMSQPPLTAAVRKLEKEIGTELIERGNKTIRLTAAGAAFLEEARRTVVQADRAVQVAREAAAGRSGTVRLCYVGSSLYGRLPRLISLYRQEAPGVRLELREATSAQQIRMLREDRADIGLVVMPVPDTADMRLLIFDNDRLAIALPRRHRLAGRKVKLAALADEPFVLWPAPEGKGFTCGPSGSAPQRASCRPSSRKRMACMPCFRWWRWGPVCPSFPPICRVSAQRKWPTIRFPTRKRLSIWACAGAMGRSRLQ
jgi:DNA-binding transcriptional LysR family regulator